MTDSNCPDYSFPLAEPDYSNKAPRDLSAYGAALAAFPAARATELESLLSAATIPDIQRFFRDARLTAADLVLFYLDRIRRYDIGRLNAVLTVNPHALAAAQALDAERARGEVRGPLHGIPILVKDNIATGDGMPTTAGAYALRGWIPDRDAFLIRQLRAAGAIILGKANLSEFANYTDPCTPNGFSTLGGQTQNPHGPFDPYGSSSGSAVAVATNLVTAAVGSETQGSIIMPAWVNGVVGLKTSMGLVSRDYIVPLLEPQDVAGPLGRSVTDIAILLSAMTGTDENDPATAAAAALAGVNFAAYATLESARRVRVGVPVRRDAAQNEREPEVVMAALEAQGIAVTRIDRAELEAIPTPDIEAVLPFGFRDCFDRFMTALGERAPVRSLAEVAAVNLEDLPNRAPYGQRHIRGAVESAMTAEEYNAAIARGRHQTQRDIRAFLTRHGVDVVVIEPDDQQYAAAGFPALSVPHGLDQDGRPRAVVFMGDYLSEPELIAVGYAFEQASGGPVVPDLARFNGLPTG